MHAPGGAYESHARRITCAHASRASALLRLPECIGVSVDAASVVCVYSGASPSASARTDGDAVASEAREAAGRFRASAVVSCSLARVHATHPYNVEIGASDD